MPQGTDKSCMIKKVRFSLHSSLNDCLVKGSENLRKLNTESHENASNAVQVSMTKFINLFLLLNDRHGCLDLCDCFVECDYPQFI